MTAYEWSMLSSGARLKLQPINDPTGTVRSKATATNGIIVTKTGESKSLTRKTRITESRSSSYSKAHTSASSAIPCIPSTRFLQDALLIIHLTLNYARTSAASCMNVKPKAICISPNRKHQRTNPHCDKFNRDKWVSRFCKNAHKRCTTYALRPHAQRPARSLARSFREARTHALSLLNHRNLLLPTRTL